MHKTQDIFVGGKVWIIQLEPRTLAPWTIGPCKIWRGNSNSRGRMERSQEKKILTTLST